MNYIKKIVMVTIVLYGLSFVYTTQTARADNPGCKSECKTCASVCENTLNYCRKQGHVDPQHIKVMQDCISTCKQSADFMARGSALQNSACALCEKACSSCAQSCAAFKKDKTMQSCAEECRKCAQSCAKMTQ